MNRLELLKLIANAPKNLKGYSELLDYARNIYKRMMGVFPEGIDNISIKQAVKDIANQRDPKKVVPFPKGGKDKLDPFKPRSGEFGITVLDDAGKPLETKSTTAEGIMDLLMSKGKGADTNIGKAPKTTKKKPDVDPELKKSDDQKQLFMDFENRNKKGELFNISGQKGKFLTEDEFARELESDTANFIQNSPGFNLQLIPELKKPGAKAYNPFPDKQGDKFLTDDQRQRVLSRLERIMKNEEYQTRFADNFADLMEEGEDVIEFAPDLFKIDPPKKADGGRIGFKNAGFAGDPMEGDRFSMAQPQQQGPMGPVFQTNDPGEAAKEVMRRMAGTGLMSIPMGGGFGLDFGSGAGRSIDAGISFNPQNPNFNFQAGAGILQGKPVLGLQFNKLLSGGMFGLGKKDGGRIGFKEGTPKDPSKRSFLKLMGGLAAIPFIGKFFKPAAKVVEKAAPVVQEGAKLGYENFMLLVDKIKRLGKSADNLATQERQKVTTYKGKDGSEYELVEDLSTGDISVTKDKPGIAVANRGTDDAEAIDVIQDRSTFIYRKGEDVVDTKTGKSVRTPDEYDEVKQTSGDGEGFDGIDEIDDKSVNEVLNELTDVAELDDLTLSQYLGPGSPRSKKAGGGLAYMLGE